MSALGSRGDVNPVLGVAEQLRELGADVVVLLPGNYVHLAEGLGLRSEAVIAAEDFERLTRDPDLWHHYRGPRMLLDQMVGQHLDRLWAVIDRHAAGAGTKGAGPVLVSHPLDFASGIYRERYPEVTHISLQLAPVMIRSWADPPRMGRGIWGMRRPVWWFQLQCYLGDQLLFRRWLEPHLNRLRRLQGLPRQRRPLHRACFSEDGVLCLFPRWYGAADAGDRFHHAGFPLFDGPEARNGSPVVGSQSEHGEGALLFTAGTAHRTAREFFSAAADVCERLGRAGLLLTGDPSLVPAHLPAGVERVGYMPLGGLLESADAIVHHGGIGTTSQALARGVPQVVCPLAFDQFDNAMRVRRLGCGLELPMRSVTTDRLEQSVREVLRRRASGEWDCQRVASQVSSGPEVLRGAAWWVIRGGRRKAAGNPCFTDGG